MKKKLRANKRRIKSQHRRKRRDAINVGILFRERERSKTFIEVLSSSVVKQRVTTLAYSHSELSQTSVYSSHLWSKPVKPNHMNPLFSLFFNSRVC